MAGSAPRRALLFVNPHKTPALALAEAVAAALARRGFEACFYPFENQGAFEPPANLVIAFSLGGDGTVLFAARILAPWGIPLIPINFGSLGFIAVVPPDNWEAVFEQWLAGKAGVSRRLMLEIIVERRGEILTRASCLNDAVISASGIAKIIALEVKIASEGESIRLGHYRSDGLIVATPTGSTAYSVAAGGPILDPEIEAVIINPICPFTLSNRPIVLPVPGTVIVEVEAEQRSGVLLTLDGQATKALEPGDQIRLYRAPYDAKFAALDRQAFYRALQMKLNWPGAASPGGVYA